MLMFVMLTSSVENRSFIYKIIIIIKLVFSVDILYERLFKYFSPFRLLAEGWEIFYFILDDP
jgi:hypothetical protein